VSPGEVSRLGVRWLSAGVGRIGAALTIRLQGLKPGSILCHGEMETDETSKCR